MEHYGVIGRPIGHSLSPLLHRLIYEQTGYRAEYSRFDVDPARMEGVIPAMRALGLRGLNVTSPHKLHILPYIDELSPTAATIGAVNTVLIREDGTVYGDNTDSYGFAHTLSHGGIATQGGRFVLCGYAGAGKAVVHALEQGGAKEIVIASTDPEKGISYEELKRSEPRDVIINCTPVGMTPNVEESVVDGDTLALFSAAVDLIYHPPETKFMRLAAERGLKALNGLWMLIYQGIRSFEIWTGCDTAGIDVDKIYDTLRGEL